MDNVVIRSVRPCDAEELLAIYAPYVLGTAISFEYAVPSRDEFRGRIEKTLEKYPYLAAIINGEIVGYAYLSAFSPREAYSHTAETTVYVKQGETGRGVGKALYLALEDAARAQNILNLCACVACPDSDDEFLTHNSADFHLHMGYSCAGELHKCGCKFGRWYNIVWMEKAIGEHGENPAPVIPFPLSEH